MSEADEDIVGYGREVDGYRPVFRKATAEDVKALLALQKAEHEAEFEAAKPTKIVTLPQPERDLPPFDDTYDLPKPSLYYRPPPGFPTPYFKGLINPEGDLFLDKFGGVLSEQQEDNSYPGFLRKRIPMPNLKSKLVRVLMEPECIIYFNRLRENDPTFYPKSILAAAEFAALMISKDGLYNYAIEDRVISQTVELWDNLNATMKLSRTDEEVLNKVISRLMNRTTGKYSLLTEPDIGDILFKYSVRKHSNLDIPYDKSCPRFPEVKRDELYRDIVNTVKGMHSCIKLTVDEYLHFLVAIVRDKCDDATIGLILPALINLDDFPPRLIRSESIDDLKIIFHILICRFQEEISDQLASVISPLDVLASSHEQLIVTREVCEVVEIADIRRRVLGKRFIGRDMFVWAFYHCGYGLPPKICSSLMKYDIVDENHAFSQICINSVKLASYLDENQVALVHFMFAVLYPRHTLDGDQVTKSLRQFKAFVKELDSKRSQQPDVIPPVYDPEAFKIFFEGLATKMRTFGEWSH